MKFVRNRVVVSFEGAVSRTQQSFKDSSDINKIVAKYRKTGHIEYFNPAQPNYGFAPSISYLEAMQQIDSARTKFMEIPAAIREKFDHDPLKFMAFCEDPLSRPELAAMGLLAPTPDSGIPESNIRATGSSEAPAHSPAKQDDGGAVG